MTRIKRIRERFPSPVVHPERVAGANVPARNSTEKPKRGKG